LCYWFGRAPILGILRDIVKKVYWFFFKKELLPS
jgi:hypothetical protein